MVNYHAIGTWFTSRGGFALHNPQEEASLKVSTFVLAPEGYIDSTVDDASFLGDKLAEVDNQRIRKFPYLRQAFVDFVDQFGPNDFFVLQKSLKEDVTSPPLRTVVSLLKLGDWDPDVFFKFRDVILSSAPSCGTKLRNDLCRGIPRVWENYYQLDTDKDIAFEIGRFYYGVREYSKALEFYLESTRLIGEHHVTFHNQGLCYYSLDNMEMAKENFSKAYGMCAEYEKAKSWLDKVTTEIEHRQLRVNVAGMTMQQESQVPN
jgi:tetratricopeptide (TPR) repeat protein